jgi:hypothetical protein
VDEYMFYSGLWSEHSLYSLVLPNALTATNLKKEIEQVQGVKIARIDLVDEHFDLLDGTGKYIEAQMKYKGV